MIKKHVRDDFTASPHRWRVVMASLLLAFGPESLLSSRCPWEAIQLNALFVGKHWVVSARTE